MRLTGVNGKLLCAEGGGGEGSVLNARTIPGGSGGWEEFELVNAANGTVGLKSERGFYVSAQPDGRIEVNRPVLGPWEEWTRIPVLDGYAFLSHHGLFMCCDLGLPVHNLPEWSGHRVIANRGGLGPWEIFRTGQHIGEGIFPFRTRDAYFEKADGTRVTIKESTQFRLLERMLKGEDVTPVLRQQRDMGFNVQRVLGTCHNMFRLYPADHADYFTVLRDMAKLLADYDQVLEFTCFADAPYAIPGTDHQLDHWYESGASLQDFHNVMAELVNENDVHWNTIDTDAFTPLNLHCSHGSNGSQAHPVRPVWDSERFHTNDAFEWWRKGGHNSMEYYGGFEGMDGGGVPIICNEKTRPDKDPNLNHHQDDAAGAALLCAGSCFHSNAGKDSVLLTGLDLAAAEAFLAGANSVPLEAQGQPYRRRDDLLTPDLLRVYQRGFDDSHIVRIRR